MIGPLPDSPSEYVKALTGLAALIATLRGIRIGALRRGVGWCVDLMRAKYQLEMCRQDKAELTRSNATLRVEIGQAHEDYGRALSAGSGRSSPASPIPSPTNGSRPTSPRPRKRSGGPAKPGRSPGSSSDPAT